MIKSCGGCRHWTKWKYNVPYFPKGLGSDGLCQLRDGRCPSDHVCSMWEGKKYQRIKAKLEDE